MARGMGGRTSPGAAGRAVAVVARRTVRPPPAPLIVLALLASGLCFAGPAAAKSYQIGDVRIVADVRPNGDVVVTERAPSPFDGDFHYVYWDLSIEGQRRHQGARRRRPKGPLERRSTGRARGYRSRAAGAVSR